VFAFFAPFCTLVNVCVFCVLAVAAQCLLTYNYVISEKDGNSAAQRALLTQSLPGGSAGRHTDTPQTRRCLLLGGRRDGCLCVYNWDTGAVDYLTKVLLNPLLYVMLL